MKPFLLGLNPSPLFLYDIKNSHFIVTKRPSRDIILLFVVFLFNKLFLILLNMLGNVILWKLVEKEQYNIQEYKPIFNFKKEKEVALSSISPAMAVSKFLMLRHWSRWLAAWWLVGMGGDKDWLRERQWLRLWPTPKSWWQWGGIISDRELDVGRSSKGGKKARYPIPEIN